MVTPLIISKAICHYSISRFTEAICDQSLLPSWSGYETTTLPNVILSGQTIGYTCSETQSMIPVGEEAWDPESDGMINVTCSDGAFERPQAGDPPPCVPSSNIECNSRPEPPEVSGCLLYTSPSPRDRG